MIIAYNHFLDRSDYLKKIIISCFLLISLLACSKPHPAEGKQALVCEGEIPGLDKSWMISTYLLEDNNIFGYRVEQSIPFELTEAYIAGASVDEVIEDTMELYKSWKDDQLEYSVSADDNNFIHKLKISDISKASRLELELVGLALDPNQVYDAEVVKESAEANSLKCIYK